MVVFLPGRRDRLGAFGRHEFPRIAAEHGVAVDMVEVDAHIGYYEGNLVARRLHEDVIGPALTHGYEGVWLVGISMGGFGALLTSHEHPERVRGVLLLAPYLGDAESPVVREVFASGLKSWRPGPRKNPGEWERDLWSWLKRYAEPETVGLPALFLGYGEKDELAPTNQLLAEVLPSSQVFRNAGGHRWPVWQELWREFLRSGALQRDCGARP